VNMLLHELSSDESEGESESPIDPQSPWTREFHLYLNTATSLLVNVHQEKGSMP